MHSRRTRRFKTLSSGNIEIIGQAVNHINRADPEYTIQHPELPWAKMRDMRNIVVHAYFAVDLRVIWQAVTEDLPRLKQQINSLIKGPNLP
jgi:uncharacterized protein with HEPN domain